MGSFNETCLVSNLPIKSGQEVMMVLLQPKPDAFEGDNILCYINAYADVAPLPFYGKYNDYGSVEDYHGPAMDILVEQIREVVEEKAQGPNPYHDVPVLKKDLDMAKILEASWEGRLAVYNYGDAKPIQYAFILQSVADKIFNEFQVNDSYFQDVGTGKSKKSIYHRYSYGFKTIVNHIPEVVQRLRARIAELNDESAEDSRIRRIYRNEILNGLFERDEFNIASKYLRFGRHEGESRVIFSPEEFIMEHASNMSDPELTELLIEFAKVQWLRRFMDEANKVWIKPITSGQEGHTDAHKLIAEVTTEYIVAAREEWFDETGEDPDEAAHDAYHPPRVNLDEVPDYGKQFRIDSTVN